MIARTTLVASICNKFLHLSRVANELMPLQNVEIGLLLGYDVSYVHQPQEIVASVNESDPYAVRTIEHREIGKLEGPEKDWLRSRKE